MKHRKLALALLLAIGAASLAGRAAADCGPDTLGTARTITLKRESALYGTEQHKALPLEKGEIVLTFDDGPVPATTPLVLKALADQCARATFFMMGIHLDQAPALARQVVAEGHSAGIHSNTHPHLAGMAPDDQLADLKKAQAAYRTVFGVDAPAYRFPFLEETPTMLAALREDKVTVMSIDLGITDWLDDDDTARLTRQLAQSLAKAGGGILLMHDAHAATANAMPALLKLLRDQHYKVVHLEWEP